MLGRTLSIGIFIRNVQKTLTRRVGDSNSLDVLLGYQSVNTKTNSSRLYD